jgi:hypothetical protein
MGVLLSLRPIVPDHHAWNVILETSSTSLCSSKNPQSRPQASPGECNNLIGNPARCCPARLAAILAKHPEVVYSERTVIAGTVSIFAPSPARRRAFGVNPDACNFSLDNQKTWRHNLQG